MFRVLMGDKAEPRREFIEKDALDVRNLDVLCQQLVFYIVPVIFDTIPGQNLHSCCHGLLPYSRSAS
jgi:hypothetical protein